MKEKVEEHMASNFPPHAMSHRTLGYTTNYVGMAIDGPMRGQTITHDQPVCHIAHSPGFSYTSLGNVKNNVKKITYYFIDNGLSSVWSCKNTSRNNFITKFMNAEIKKAKTHAAKKAKNDKVRQYASMYGKQMKDTIVEFDVSMT